MYTAFVRGWELTLVMVATMPALMLVSMACSVAAKKLQVIWIGMWLSASGGIQSHKRSTARKL